MIEVIISSKIMDYLAFTVQFMILQGSFDFEFQLLYHISPLFPIINSLDHQF